MAKVDLRVRRPKTEKLPDGRLRCTFALKVLEWVGQDKASIAADVFLAWGTEAEKFPGLRLIGQTLDGLEPNPDNSLPLIRVYEEIHATDETAVGSPTKIRLEDGRDALEVESIQLSTGTYTPGTIGTTTYSGDASAFLQRAEATDNGTVRNIKRTYVYAGTLDQNDETKNNGALLLRTLVAVKTEPATPSGYTLVGQQKKNVNGLIVYTYTFAKGSGQIGQDDDTRNNGALLIRSIRHLVAPEAANPIATPSGYTAIKADYADQDGHRLWSATFAKGDGQIAQTDASRNNGALLLRTIRHLVAPAAANPIATPSGYAAVDADYDERDGHRLWTATFAKGAGTISSETEFVQSNDEGTTGITRITTRSLVAPGVADPHSAVSGYVKVSSSYSDQDGHRVWTTTYAKGAGTVITEVDTRNNGKLVLYHRVGLVNAPSTPAATIGGTVTLVSSTVRKESGLDVHDYRWAEGEGIVSEQRQPRDGGLLLLNRDILVAPAATDISAYTPAAGILVAKDYTELDGHRRYSATWMQKLDGADPATGTAASWASYVRFAYPGRAKYYSVAFTTGSYTSHTARDVFLSPPVETLVLATTTITYQTSATVGALTHTLWNPTEWATLRARWIAWSNSPRSKVEGLRGYLAVNSGASGTSGGSGLDTAVLGDRVYASTDWAITLSGGPADPGGSTWTLDATVEPAFVAADGTQYYRRTVVHAAIPAQPALPV